MNWSEYEDDALKVGYEAHRTASEIAATLGRTPGAVRGRASALGIAKAKLSEPEESEFENEAVCQYCGQISMPGEECNCPEAKRERRIKDQILRAKNTIREVFGQACQDEGYKPVSAENIEIMDAAAVQIANYKMHAVSLVLSSGTRAKLTRGAKGVIKVERSETKKTTLEVGE